MKGNEDNLENKWCLVNGVSLVKDRLFDIGLLVSYGGEYYSNEIVQFESEYTKFINFSKEQICYKTYCYSCALHHTIKDEK